MLEYASSVALHTGNAIRSLSTMPKSHDREASVSLWDMARSEFVFARLSTRTPQRVHTKSGMRTCLRFTSFQSFVSSDPRSSSAMQCPRSAKCRATARQPTAPMAIFRKKLESGLSDSRASDPLPSGVGWTQPLGVTLMARGTADIA